MTAERIRRGSRVVVEVPAAAGPNVAEAIFLAVADAVYDAEPTERDRWDISVYAEPLDAEGPRL